MLPDSLRWILFHTPLSSEQHLCCSLSDACMVEAFGWVEVEMVLERP